MRYSNMKPYSLDILQNISPEKKESQAGFKRLVSGWITSLKLVSRSIGSLLWKQF